MKTLPYASKSFPGVALCIAVVVAGDENRAWSKQRGEFWHRAAHQLLWLLMLRLVAIIYLAKIKRQQVAAKILGGVVVGLLLLRGTIVAAAIFLRRMGRCW